MIFSAEVEVPNETGCGGDSVCMFLRKKCKVRKVALRGSIGQGQVSMKAGIEGDIRLKRGETRITLKSAYLLLKLGTETGMLFLIKKLETFTVS